ncbi:maltose permease [Exophiala viscosa]|uniref:maltose permease n=1 Tax=Exophiala viscosa TaxID=2486360 RepID=UPI0021971B8D|nr:maltose permease [Exophiala viscosa]
MTNVDVHQLNEAEKSLAHTRFEHELGFWQAVRYYRPAILWGCFANLAVILCGFDGALIGSLAGLAPFNRTYGQLVNGSWSVPPHWLSAFNYAAYVGSIPGALMGGWAYDKFGVRIALAAFSLGSIGSIFLQFFSQGSAVLFVGELLNGVITGGYPVIANAYLSEVSPVVTRGVIAAFINLSYVIGQLVASGLLKGTSTMDSKWAYKIPFACQWLLPVFILSLIFFIPAGPFWLCKNGKYEEAYAVLKRLTTGGVDIDCQLANVKETIRLEEASKSKVSIIECFRGTNLRRTMISCQVFNMQALCGNILFINYAVYFFEIAGLDAADAFSMNIGLTCLGFIGTLASYIIISYVGRRTIYLWGSASIALLVGLIGILGAIPASQHSGGAAWAMCAFMVITDFIYDLSVGPLCFTIMSEVSSVKLRGITIALSNVSVVIFSVVFAVAIPYALDTNGANWGGKLGFLFFGVGILDTLWVWFCLPETKGRTFEELDLMFQNKVPTRKFKTYQIEGTHIISQEIDGHQAP